MMIRWILPIMAAAVVMPGCGSGRIDDLESRLTAVQERADALEKKAVDVEALEAEIAKLRQYIYSVNDNLHAVDTRLSTSISMQNDRLQDLRGATLSMITSMRAAQKNLLDQMDKSIQLMSPTLPPSTPQTSPRPTETTIPISGAVESPKTTIEE